MAATVRKVSLAIGNAELLWAERRARAENTSVSAILTEAARQARRAQEERAQQEKAWARFLSSQTDGAGLTEAELAAAKRELDGE